MDTKYTIQDLIETAATLRFLRSDLTDMMNDLCEEWIDEVKDLVKRYRAKESITQAEIDNMVEWHNDICKEEAYPSMLPITNN
jgi:hypothetical protein